MRLFYATEYKKQYDLLADPDGKIFYSAEEFSSAAGRLDSVTNSVNGVKKSKHPGDIKKLLGKAADAERKKAKRAKK